MSLTITFQQKDSDDKPGMFAPGDSIKGIVRWTQPQPIHGLEVSLLFESKGKGTPQREVADTKTIRDTRMSGDSDFSFAAPEWPWSFSGKLISLVWLVQVTYLEPDGTPSEDPDLEQPIAVSPSRSELDLYAYPITDKPLKNGWMGKQQAAARRQKRNAWRS